MNYNQVKTDTGFSYTASGTIATTTSITTIAYYDLLYLIFKMGIALALIAFLATKWKKSQ